MTSSKKTFKDVLGLAGSAISNYLRVHVIPLCVLVLMIIVAAILSPAFFTKLNLVNILIQQTTIMVCSMGMFAVILTGGIDLSVGSILALAGVLCADFANKMPLGLAFLLTIVICALIGAVNGTIVAKLRIAPFIVTLGMQSIARGIAYWYSKSTPISWSKGPGAEVLTALGRGRILSVPYQTVTWIIMIIITAVLIRKSIVGRIIYAMGGNEEAVTISGINVKNWKILPYIFSSICCAVGGILLMSRLSVGSPISGQGLETDCIAAVVIGGTSFAGGKGTISGVVIGVFILGIINNILDLMNVSAYPQLMLKGGIIILAVILSTIRDKNA